MASTYSGTLNLELQTTGENSGTWGTITNNNLQKLESAIKGYVAVAIASTSDSLTATDGTTADETSNVAIKLTGTLTGNTTMSCEANQDNWFIIDNAATMGTYTLGFKPASGTAASLVAGSKHIMYTDGTTMFDVLDDAGNITANGTLDVAGDVELNGGDFVFNNTGADKNFTIESDDDDANFFSDGGEDRIGIGTDTPSTKLDVVGGIKATGAIDFDGGNFTFNESSGDKDFRIESNGNAYAFFVDGGNDRVGIFTTSPSVALDITGETKIDSGAFTWNDSGGSVDFRCETNTLDDALFIDGSADAVGFGCQDPSDAMVEINQSNSTAAIACLSLDQDDTDQEFIKFDGTTASDQSSSLTTDTSVGSITGHIRVNINGTDFWLAYYATN